MAPRSTVVAAMAGALLLAATGAVSQGPPVRRLASGGVLDAMPAWAPDGRIVFHSRRPRDESRGIPTRNIWAMPATGGEAIRLSAGLADEYHPSVSPDGRKIAFVSESSGSRDVWVMAADGSNPVPLTDDAGLEDHPAWSPDGRRIVYVALPKEGGNLDLWIMNDDGSAKRKLTFTAANEIFPAWHPDGRSIALVTDAAGQFDVHLFRLDDERTVPLLAGPDHETRPSFSPAGTRLAFARWTPDESGDAARIWIANADGTLPLDLGLPPGSTNPAWSPSGSELAFQRRTEGGWEIWTAALPRDLLAGPRLDLARTGVARDVMELRGGRRVEGTLGLETFRLRAGYGALAIPARHVASIGFAGLDRGTALVLLRNGDTFSGFLEHETLAFAGAVESPRIERIERVDLRPRRGARLVPLPLRVAMRNGDAFQARMRSPGLRLRIGGQRLDLPFGEVARVDFGGDDGAKTRILTRKGEAMTAAVENRLFEVELATGGRLDLHPAAIRTLTPTEASP